MINSNWKIMLLVFLVLTLAGCSGPARILVQVERPPTLNTTGIKRIAIMPFETDDSAHNVLAAYATSMTASRIRETGRFTLVDASEILRLRRRNQNVEDYVDAMFIGRITRASVSNETKTTAGWTDNKGRYYPPVNTYYTAVEIEFNYSLKMARDGRLIGPVSKKGVASAQSGDGYPDAEGLLRNALTSQIATIRQDIAPYRSTEVRTLAEDKTGISGVKEEMKEALAHVKAQNYKIALEAYLKIYEQHKSVAAAENASILYEALDDAEAALSLMQKVYEDTGNPTVQAVIARLNRNLADKAKVAANKQKEEQKPVDRVTAVASEEIQKILPGNAVVWLYNNSPGNTMVDAIVDNLTAEFIRKEIGIVDRQNTALIEAEQRHHVSGAVSDDEMIRIGNAAGAKTIVVIGITGSGAMRRLQVRVLDIERGVPIMQSDTDKKWRL
ncbi:MAG: hypothetical protein LBU89_01335 [Fibromonadaceae bacterium]|jgi:hypothetical protein|nr:hypothetical protein [Fibromonadaceae bacterium]